MPQPQKDGAGSLSKFELQTPQRLFTQASAAYGSMRILVSATNLPVTKVRQIVHAKRSHSKFSRATPKVRRMKAFARFTNESWCMDLAYLDKKAKDNNGIKYFFSSSRPV